MAPNWGGQCRRQASQLMQIDMSIFSGGNFHFGFRSRLSSRSARLAAPTPRSYAAAAEAAVARPAERTTAEETTPISAAPTSAPTHNEIGADDGGGPPFDGTGSRPAMTTD